MLKTKRSHLLIDFDRIWYINILCKALLKTGSYLLTLKTNQPRYRLTICVLKPHTRFKFFNLEGVELYKCQTIGSIWNTLTWEALKHNFYIKTVDQPTFQSLAKFGFKTKHL